MKSILDPSFRYTKSVETDLRKTFARARREIRKRQQEQAAAGVDVAKVLPFNSRSAAVEGLGGRGCRLAATGTKLKDS
jgi:hypothetical protein